MNSSLTLPEKFLERLQSIYNTQDYEQILASFSLPTIPSFRVNTLKSTMQKVENLLSADGFILASVPWYPDAFLLKNKSTRELTETETYKNGYIYIQNLSSMVPVLVLSPQPNENILDIAAAPGSKTTQIAAFMDNKGTITANDLSFKRAFKLKDNLSQTGVTNTQVLTSPGESLWKKFPEFFDRTLVDVPCSMEGRIRAEDSKTYQDWSPKKIKQLAKLQQYLLRSAISATKIGGTIVYSTCTLSPEENEEVIEWAVKKTDGAVQTEPIEIPGLQLQSGLQSWKNKPLHYAKHTYRILPHDNMEGFFVTKLCKTASTLPKIKLR